MNLMSQKRTYQPSDVAFIIPTKDRPHKIKNLMKRIAEQSVMCGRLIVVERGLKNSIDYRFYDFCQFFRKGAEKLTTN